MGKLAVNIAVCSVTMTAAAFLFMLMLKPLKKVQSAKWRYYSWVLIFLGFLVPIKPWSGEAAIHVNARSTSVSMQVADRFYSVDTCFAEFDFTRILQIAFVVWAVGAAAHLLAALIRQMLFNRSIRRLSKPAEERVYALIDDIADELMIWERIKAVTVRGIGSPMTVGFFKPTVIIPEISFSDSELRLILEHELVHFKRRDLFVKAFTVLVASVHWFNPFVRLFIRRAERECEMYCDETVMRGRSAEEKRLYCEAILNSASAGAKENGRRIGARFKPAVSSNFFSGKAGMKHRMKMILSGNKKHGLGLVCTAAAVALTLFSSTVLAFSSYEGGIFGDGVFVETTVTATSIPVIEAELNN